MRDDYREQNKQIKKQNDQLQELWIKHSKTSKYSGTLAFNKKDQDSIANPKNKPIVPFRGVKKNWGIEK